MNNKRFQRIVKRTIDVVVSIVVLAFCLPLLVCIALLIRRQMGRPILFRQLRPGRHGRPFKLVKFRTMTDARGPDGLLLASAERLTGLGKFLRRCSLDELPQFWNVLRGEMSLVGPRPLLMEYVDRYNAEQFRRHDVTPGITGWAQINGRNAISWERKLELDVWYVDHWSLPLDLWIMLASFWNVFSRKGIDAGNGVGMPAFMGTQKANNDLSAEPEIQRGKIAA